MVCRLIEPGRSLQLILDFPDASLCLVGVHSNPAQSAAERKRWLAAAFQSRLSGKAALTTAAGDLNLIFPGGFRLDIATDTRDFTEDPLGNWLQNTLGNFRTIGYDGFSCAGRAGGRIHHLAAFDRTLCDLHPLDLVDVHAIARVLGKVTDSFAVSDPARLW